MPWAFAAGDEAGEGEEAAEEEAGEGDEAAAGEEDDEDSVGGEDPPTAVGSLPWLWLPLLLPLLPPSPPLALVLTVAEAARAAWTKGPMLSPREGKPTKRWILRAKRASNRCVGFGFRGVDVTV